MKDLETRRKGDKILEEMAGVQANFGTGSSKDLKNKKDRNTRLCDLWRELKKIDPERAEIIKPQNPYIK